MDKDSILHSLKLKLSNYGAVQPHVWTKILESVDIVNLKVDESFNREIESVAYLAKGILKEYDPHFRKKPSIINFISSGNFIITTKSNQSRYLKAITETSIVYLNFYEVISLYSKYKELKLVYDSIISNYEDGISFRYVMLEERSAQTRIQNFIARHKEILSKLKKKDIANYVHLEYDYFIRIYSKLL